MSYCNEYKSALQRIAANNPDVRGLRFFLETTVQWHAFFDERPDGWPCPASPIPTVAVLGHGVPEQLVRACGVAPLHLLGGSHASCQWSDDLMPRDSDPASRSTLGYALQLARRADLDMLFVVPTTCDNLRKIAYILKREGHAVLPLDVPPTVANTAALQAWERSADALVQTVGRHVGRRATALSLCQADRIVGEARSAALEFERTCVNCNGALDDEARLLVLGSYYGADDLEVWTSALRRLCAEVQARHQSAGRPTNSLPRVLVIGSPLLFPQYKVPTLIHDAGLSLLASVDAASTARYAQLDPKDRRGGLEQLTHAIARRQYQLDSTGAHVVNRMMEQYVEHLLATTQVDGVVCHILKGQIEHDFLLARLEPLFEQCDVPVFRLETDYQYQDVEQLRIRLEAFAEMLTQRAFAQVRPSTALRHCA